MLTYEWLVPIMIAMTIWLSWTSYMIWVNLLVLLLFLIKLLQQNIGKEKIRGIKRRKSVRPTSIASLKYVIIINNLLISTPSNITINTSISSPLNQSANLLVHQLTLTNNETEYNWSIKVNYDVPNPILPILTVIEHNASNIKKAGDLKCASLKVTNS